MSAELRVASAEAEEPGRVYPISAGLLRSPRVLVLLTEMDMSEGAYLVAPMPDLIYILNDGRQMTAIVLREIEEDGFRVTAIAARKRP